MINYYFKNYKYDLLIEFLVIYIFIYCSYFISQTNKRQKRKGGSKSTTSCQDTESNPKDKISNVLAIMLVLDKLGLCAYRSTSNLIKLAQYLTEICQSWSDWSKNHATNIFVQLSSDLCKSLLNKQILTQV